MSTINTIKAVLSAYIKAELLRSKGFIIGAFSLMLWLIMFLAPAVLFRSPQTSPEVISTYALVAIGIFVSYSAATWDWAWELRWLMYQGILEHVILSGESVFLLFAGILPVSMIWLTLAMLGSYMLLTGIIAPPQIVVAEPTALLTGVASLAIVLVAYALLLGGVTISTGTSGPIMELIGWVLPIATGGLVPLAALPKAVQYIALATPFSYPAELIRYGLGLASPVLDPSLTAYVALAYTTGFLIFAVFFFKFQLKKILKEGVKTVAVY